MQLYGVPCIIMIIINFSEIISEEDLWISEENQFQNGLTSHTQLTSLQLITEAVLQYHKDGTFLNFVMQDHINNCYICKDYLYF